MKIQLGRLIIIYFCRLCSLVDSGPLVPAMPSRLCNRSAMCTACRFYQTISVELELFADIGWDKMRWEGSEDYFRNGSPQFSSFPVWALPFFLFSFSLFLFFFIFISIIIFFFLFRQYRGDIAIFERLQIFFFFLFVCLRQIILNNNNSGKKYLHTFYINNCYTYYSYRGYHSSVINQYYYCFNQN